MKVRSKYYSLVLYPNEDITHKDCINYIVNNIDYALICHDKDINEDLTLKKEHYHIVLAFPNYRWIDSVQEELKIPINYIEKSSSLESALKYLIHYNNKEKFQYDISQVSGTLKNRLERFISKDLHSSENSESLLILETIRDWGVIEYGDFLQFICENDLYATYRRNYISFKDIINEHNSKLNEKKMNK